ncbi:MerR family transcriptional regulator [Streptomyces sp. NBC_01754]|uniref:MerR family transcriptional regulator n=1 Tax=Streptomyces sp. NBC_01754 TaxID=2975930 RepID=UPI002DDC353F|nr:MerR family transcriptional regulator [Streptomyces sp. NBC_01754]WSC94109.1 MerR family transcriptional regulator [Streptomyces sp. NBC_01754]
MCLCGVRLVGGPVGGSQRVLLRTIDVARESGYSVQQVRDLERSGVIPPAARSANGYRSYTQVHVRALGAYRGLAGAVGPVEARKMLVRLRTETLTEAASAISAVHARLAREREETLRAQQALRAIEAEAHTPGSEREGDAMTITELAGALGVRSSALRFWEQEGLVLPERVTSLRARRYGPSAVGAARIVVALRGAGYGIPEVRGTMASLHRHDGSGEARRVLRQRLDRIAARAVALLRAGADLAAVVASADGTAAVQSCHAGTERPGGRRD